MSVWPEGISPAPALSGAEGQLVSVSISIEPRLLEQLLDVLARLEFPINPQLYHNATTTGQQHPATVVEFPAWASRLADVRAALRRAGFDPAALSFRGMLEDIERKARPARASA